MKTLWTLLFLALIATTVGLTLMFSTETERSDKFWLAIGAVAFAELLLWVAFTFRGTRRGQQAQGFSSLSLVSTTSLYFFITLALAAVAYFVAVLSFKLLLAFHILALLGFAFLAGLSAIGTRTLQGTREASQR
jgi:O-antigen/teichoic acid export membrane protein